MTLFPSKSNRQPPVSLRLRSVVILAAVSLLGLTFGMQSCSKSANIAAPSRGSADQQGYRKSYISVKMPDRVSRMASDSRDQALKLSAYQVTITPQTSTCGKQVSETGEYKDRFWIQIEVDGNCAYTVEARFGAGGVSTNITFRADIEPIFRDYCHECHVKGGLMEYFDSTKFDQVKIRSREIMTSILNDNMPWKRDPLSPELKELFKGWEANGFAEGTSSLALRATQLAGEFSKGYYETGAMKITPENIRADSYNLGLQPVFYLTSDGQSAGFKTATFFSADR